MRAFLWISCLAPLAAAEVEVPTIGCQAMGHTYTGPPAKTRSPVRLEASLARQLAVYESARLRVLAPRGWTCSGTIGSSGDGLLVTPAPGGEAQILIKYTTGGTAGRFHVGDLIASLFPTRLAWANSLSEGFEEYKPAQRVPSDIITPLSASAARFITPAGHEGLGTLSPTPGKRPTHGYVIIRDEEGHVDAIEALVQLPKALEGLTETILKQASNDAVYLPYPEDGFVQAAFVGCPTNGQFAIPAPKRPRIRIVLDARTAAALALYESSGLSVLAPRGWSCQGHNGSNGATLYVGPQPIRASGRITGPAVVVRTISGETNSGRLQLADFIARAKLSPTRPDDLRYFTPANADGLGTDGVLQPGSLPIEGWARSRRQRNILQGLDIQTRLPDALATWREEIIQSGLRN